VKAPKKNSMPRKKRAISKKREEDSAKRLSKRNTRKKTVVSKTIAPEPDKLATALAPVQLDNEGTATQSMMSGKRKTMQDNTEMIDKRRKAITSNDVEDETELKEDLKN
jgi:hypothetical protein